MRALLFTLLLATLSFAQTGCDYPDGSIVPIGWSGPGFGENFCNTCRCETSGLLTCTRMACDANLFPGKEGESCDETRPYSCHPELMCVDNTCQKEPTQIILRATQGLRTECSLSTGETVPSGWVGKGKGDDFCNDCICMTGKLMCTRNPCPLLPMCGEHHEGDTWDTESCNPKSCSNGNVITSQEECVSILCDNGFPSKLEGECCSTACSPYRDEGMLCSAEEPCARGLACISNTCRSPSAPTPVAPISPGVSPHAPISPGVSPHAPISMECGDMTHEQCSIIPWCLWLVKEDECDEVKEMDCQDLGQTACESTAGCNWVFDDRYVCLEFKEVDSEVINPLDLIPPLSITKESGAVEDDAGSDIPFWHLLIVLVLFFCLGGATTTSCISCQRKQSSPGLLEDVAVV